MATVREQIADGRKVGVLTRDDIIKALREYGELYGPGFSQSAFNPSSAKRAGRPDLVELYYKGRPNGERWPSLNAIKTKFGGSWNDARAAAGFAPNTTGPAAGRRKAGDAEPILNVRERLVYISSAKTRQVVEKLRRAEDRSMRLEARLDAARDEVRELRARGPRVVVDRPARVKTEVKTVTKTVKVKDERALERLRSKLADSEASRRATEDQLRAEKRDHDRAMVAVENARAEAAASVRDAEDATREYKGMADRLSAAEGRVARLRAELDQAREVLVGVSEAAAASDLVSQAEARVEQAELRAARAEREMAEQGAAVTGELRRLTAGELADLRVRGPAGPAVMAKALKKLASARAGRGDMRAALAEVARAAVSWEDRL